MRSLFIHLMAVVLLLPARNVCAADEKPPFPTGGTPTALLFLHPLVNYREDPQWTRDWERELQRSNSLRVNVGSVSTDDFLTAIELHLTEPMGGRFRALYDMQWREALHVETPPQQHFLGLEFAPLTALGLQVQVHPASQKQELDLRAGAIWHDPQRDKYLRLLLRWDDPLFTEKNDRGGKSDQLATSVEWTARTQFKVLEFFSRGRYGSASRRSFPDSARAPELLADTEQRGGSESRLRAIVAEDRFFEVELLHHHYEQTTTPRDTGQKQGYRNRLVDVALRSIWGFNARWLLRGELHRLEQSAQGCGTDPFDYQRQEWMPAAFVQWRPHHSHRFELGYLATAYRWDGSPEATAVMQDGYAQKLKLGWLVDFSPKARLQISVSHEPDPQRFGGGDIQLLVLF